MIAFPGIESKSFFRSVCVCRVLSKKLKTESNFLSIAVWSCSVLFMTEVSVRVLRVNGLLTFGEVSSIDVLIQGVGGKMNL